MKKQTSHKLSIKRWVILTLIFGFVATAGAVIIDIDYSMRQLKNETAAQYLSILNMQRESLDTDIGKASAILLSYKMSGKHINQLINCKDKNEAYFAVTNVTSDLESQILNSTISEIVYAYKFGFDRFGIALSSTSHISSTEKLAVKDYVESLERETAGTTYMWKPCLIGDEWYFVYNIADRDYVIGQGIRVKTIASLFQMKLDENSSIAVLNDQEENMIDSVVARNNNQFLKNYTERYSSYNIYEGELIKEEVKNFLFSRDKHSKIDRTTLLLIVQLVINVFYSFDLQSAEHLMAKQSVANLFTKATDSPSELLLFLDAVIAQYQERRNAASADAGAALLKKVRSYIDSHIESRLDRNEISEKFFISKDYLSHLFSKYEHKGFSQYVCEERLNKAKRLMLETNLPLKVISENVGISDYAYFSKLFKSHEGVSANEFRAIHRKTS